MEMMFQFYGLYHWLREPSISKSRNLRDVKNKIQTIDLTATMRMLEDLQISHVKEIQEPIAILKALMEQVERLELAQNKMWIMPQLRTGDLSVLSHDLEHWSFVLCHRISIKLALLQLEKLNKKELQLYSLQSKPVQFDELNMELNSQMISLSTEQQITKCLKIEYPMCDDCQQ